MDYSDWDIIHLIFISYLFLVFNSILTYLTLNVRMI